MSCLVSWGLKCGKKDVPGVYADVTLGLCFIDYATKCVHGKKYQQFYDYAQCNNWLEDLIAKYVLWNFYILYIEMVDSRYYVLLLPKFYFQFGFQS